MANTHTTLKSLFEDMADAIREKDGTTESISADLFPDRIRAIAGADDIQHGDIPDYVKKAAAEVAEKVRAVQTDKTVTFVALSDLHHAGEQSDTSWQTNINAGNLHAAQAVKCLAYALDFDFAAVLGDTTLGSKTTTDALLKAQIDEIHGLLDEGFAGTPAFFTPGNHDTGEYNTLAGAAYLKKAFGDRCAGAVYGSTEYGYCYRDLESRKVRIICLNSVEGEVTGGNSASYIFSPAQLLWFAQTLYDAGSKTDAATWRIFILSHYPLDMGGAYVASNVLKAYVNGESGTWNGTTVNFSGHNGAQVACNLHGHTHCFKVDKLRSVANSVGTPYEARRAAVPNACFYRSNEVGQNDTTESWGIEFGEETTYNKTAGTAEDTAFIVGVEDPDTQVLHLFCYGAGYDRAVSYGAAKYYTITRNLTNVSVSGDVVVVEEGKPYEAALTAKDGYAVDTVTVTMGGHNVTASVYADGKISIASVTGDIVIAADAKRAYKCTNLVLTAVDSNGQPAPYTDGIYMNSSAVTAALSGSVTTGFIPIDGGTVHVYRIGGEGITWDAYPSRIAWFDSSFALKGTVMEYSKVGANQYFPTKVEDDTVAAAFATHENHAPPIGAAYFRVTAKGKGENLVITLDEPIE